MADFLLRAIFVVTAIGMFGLGAAVGFVLGRLSAIEGR